MKDKDLLIRNGVDVDKSLELFGDMAMYDETLVEFLEGINGKLSDLKKYKESSDMYNYAIVAHSLKSDCRYLGFTKLAELAYEHEIAGKNNDKLNTIRIDPARAPTHLVISGRYNQNADS